MVCGDDEYDCWWYGVVCGCFGGVGFVMNCRGVDEKVWCCWVLFLC